MSGRWQLHYLARQPTSFIIMFYRFSVKIIFDIQWGSSFPSKKKYVIYICCSRTFITFIFNHRTVQFRLITADSLFHFLLPDMLHSWYCIYIVIVSIVSISILHCIDMCCNKTIPGGECPWDANTIKDRNITLKQLISPQRIWPRTMVQVTFLNKTHWPVC